MMNALVLFRKVPKIIDSILYFMLLPHYLCVNYLIAIFIQTSAPKNDSIKYIKWTIFLPCLVILTIVTFPVGLMSFIYYLIFSRWICPNRYKLYAAMSPSNYSFNRINNVTIATVNVCGMPEFLSRFNNLPHTFDRLRKMSGNFTVNNNNNVTCESIDSATDFSIHTIFPDSDILCLQEVWDRVTGRYLVHLLSKKYQYIIYDVGDHKIETNCCLFGSGLFIASKFPFIDVDFKCFKNRTAHCRATSMGILTAKVLLNKFEKSKNQVGYISCTHLQSYPGEGKTDDLHYLQLTEIQEFVNSFKKTHYTSNDVVMFDILAGDFNFDYMSPSDVKACSHPLVTFKYVDPGCESPGVDHEWTVGTECRQSLVHEEQFSSPTRLKQALMDPVMRRYCVIDADVLKQCFDLAKSLPKCDKNKKIKFETFGGKRRVDRIYYNQDYPVTVQKYNTITALTNLTDHLPVSFTFKLRSPTGTRLL